MQLDKLHAQCHPLPPLPEPHRQFLLVLHLFPSQNPSHPLSLAPGPLGWLVPGEIPGRVPDRIPGEVPGEILGETLHFARFEAGTEGGLWVQSYNLV